MLFHFIFSQIAAVFIIKRPVMFELTDRKIIIKVDSVWVMFWYNRTYTVLIGKRVQLTIKKLKLWLTNPNRNFKETNVPQGQF